MDDRWSRGEDFGMSSSMWYNLMGDADYATTATLLPGSISNFAHYNNPEAAAGAAGRPFHPGRHAACGRI